MPSCGLRRSEEVGAQQPVLAKADADLLAPRIAFDVDVGDALLVRLDDHVVDQPHQRVVGLFDRPLVVARALEAFLFQRLDQLAGVDHLHVRGRQRVCLALAARATDALVGAKQHVVEGAALRQHRQHLALDRELDFFDRGAPARRVVQCHHQAAVAQQQRHQLQPRRHCVAQPGQRLGLGRKDIQVDQRIAHLAGQRQLQVGARDRAHAHQQLAQRHVAIHLLLRQRILQLRIADQPERQQCVADAHHGRAGLLFDGAHQLLGRDHLIDDQDFAKLARPQVVLRLQGLLDLRLRGAVLLHQHIADALPQLETPDVAARHEHAAHRTGVAVGWEQKQAVGVVDMAHGGAGQRAGVDQLDQVARLRAVRQDVVVRLARRFSHRHERCGQRQAAELFEAQWHGRACVLQLQVRDALFRHEERQTAAFGGAIWGGNFAGQRVGLRPGLGKAGERWRRPGERLGRKAVGDRRAGCVPLKGVQHVGHDGPRVQKGRAAPRSTAPLVVNVARERWRSAARTARAPPAFFARGCSLRGRGPGGSGA